ncbi:hypothetical protein RAS1_40090 [Phycisphaerae bacterium RAS1]|nr:hypothetical protein RAS1_40090 [Phycisphaerae bacterium RAS1]
MIPRRLRAIALTVVVFVPLSAPAQTAAGRWFFSLDGLSNPSDPQSPAVAPANLPPRVNPDGGLPGSRMYLWFNHPVSSRLWSGFQEYSLELRNGTAVITDVSLYNLNLIIDFGPDGAPGGGDDETLPRWDAVNEGIGKGSPIVSGIAFFAFSLSDRIGIRSGALPVGGDPHTVGSGASRATLVGHVELSPGSGSLFISHGLTMPTYTPTGAIPPSDVFIRLGFGDESTVYTGGASGDSPIAEATFTPEPGTLMLLGAASLVLLRRRP